MEDKKRLYEIFSKVNRIKITEQQEADENSELKDNAKNEIKEYFNVSLDDRMFSDGIPKELLVRVQYEDVLFKISDDDGLELIESTEEFIKYNTKFSGDLSQIYEELADTDTIIIIPVTLEIRRQNFDNEIDFDIRIWADSNNVDVDFK